MKRAKLQTKKLKLFTHMKNTNYLFYVIRAGISGRSLKASYINIFGDF